MTDRTPPAAFKALEDWLVDEGLRGADHVALVRGFAERAVAAGLPIVRFMAGTDLLHPTVGGRGYRWERGGAVTQDEYGREVVLDDNNQDWMASPLYRLYNDPGTELRRRLAIDYATGEFPLLDRLQREGLTDYAAFKVDFGPSATLGEMEGMMASVATDALAGFSEADLDRLRRLMPRLALSYKTIAGLATARTLMVTYLGDDAARRVLSGSIGRGEAEMIRAAIWYSDLEGFTRLADTLPRERLMPFLNAYAECFVEAIHGHGGQVLKFVGDGILAIFPLEGPNGVLLGKALDSAIAAQHRSQALFRSRTEAGEPVSRCFIGLHVGEVLYGNVGSRDRLDFTVLGPAVNEASRIERLCRSLEQPVIVSEAFAQALGERDNRLVALGRYALRGVGRAQELFTLDPELLQVG